MKRALLRRAFTAIGLASLPKVFWQWAAAAGAASVSLTVLSFVADLSEIMSSPFMGKATAWSAGVARMPIPMWGVIVIVLLAFLIGSSRKTSVVLGHPGSLKNEGVFLSCLRDILRNAEQEVWLCCIDKTWVFTLVFSVVSCRSRGVEIIFIFDKSQNHNRYHLLALLGCHVVAVDMDCGKLPFSGVVADPESPRHGAAVCLSIKPKEGEFGRVHYCPHDHYIISACGSLVKGIMHKSGIRGGKEAFRPTIVRVPKEEVFSKLRRVRFYRDAEFALRDVDIALTRPIARAVQAVKVAQAGDLLVFFIEQGWTPFEPAAVQLKDGRQSLIVPPILEERNGTLQVAEGHSRLFSARKRGIATVRAIVVTGVEVPPPAPCGAWKDVVEKDMKDPISAPELARHIETETHLDVWAEVDLKAEPVAHEGQP